MDTIIIMKVWVANIPEKFFEVKESELEKITSFFAARKYNIEILN